MVSRVNKRHCRVVLTRKEKQEKSNARCWHSAENVTAVHKGCREHATAADIAES